MVRYCVSYGGENAVRFWFWFFSGFYLCYFSGFFVVLLFLGPFFGKLFCNRFVQIYCSGKGDLGYRDLLVIQGKMLSFFTGSVSRLLFSSLSIMDLGCLGMSFGVTPQQLTRVTSSAVGSCFFSFLYYTELYRSYDRSLECLFRSFSGP